MWGGNQCELDCQCDGLITEKFRINGPRSGDKRRRESNMSPVDVSPLARSLHSSTFLTPSRRTILGRIENSPRRSGGKISRLLDDRRKFSTMDKENVPQFPFRTEQKPFRTEQKPFRTEQKFFRSEETFRTGRNRSQSAESKTELSFETETAQFFGSEEKTVSFFKREESFQSQTFGSETSFKTEAFFKSESSFLKSEGTFEKSSYFGSEEMKRLSPGAASEGPSHVGSSPQTGHSLRRMKSLTSWTLAQVSDDSPVRPTTPQKSIEEISSDSGYPSSGHKPSSPLLHDEATLFSLPEVQVPGNEPVDTDMDFETLHDLEEEFEGDFDKCNKYEIISTDSPNIISRGSSTRTITSRNLVFGAPIGDVEQSTSFNAFRSNPSARMLNFDDPAFQFTSPTARPSHVKKTLKFSETPNKISLRHEKSDSSIGSMSNASPGSARSVRLFSSNASPGSARGARLFTSESTNSMESGFASEVEDAFFEMEGDFSPKVANFGELLSGRIKDGEGMEEGRATPSRPSFFRSMSLNADAGIDKVRISLFKSSLESPTQARLRGFKRPERPATPAEEDARSKRRKANREPRPVLQRAMSENCASIMSALARSASNPDLIGDFSRPCALPLTGGSHDDLKSISGDTLAALMAGEFRDTIAHFEVIDCRYPYEFAGGHIRGARNLYTREHIQQLLQETEDRTVRSQDGSVQFQDGSVQFQDGSDQNKENEHGSVGGRQGRTILIFHCEFSIERGPKLSRYLRTSDRAANKDRYPSLRYPELYLLHDGYSRFHRQHPQLCEPSAYVPMLHPAHKADLVRYRASDTVPLHKASSMDERRCKSRSRLPL